MVLGGTVVGCGRYGEDVDDGAGLPLLLRDEGGVRGGEKVVLLGPSVGMGVVLRRGLDGTGVDRCAGEDDDELAASDG